MSWIVDSSLSWFQRLCINVVKTGPVPKHVAFIMDGNRRFAKKVNAENVKGHSKGFDKLAETLQWCSDLGIHEVTVYAFSIENFKRSDEEVSTLMKLAKEKFEKILKERDTIMEYGVCIRVIGNLSLMSAELRNVIAKAMLMTENNNKSILNIAFAYTSRDEITNAIKCIVDGVETGLLDEKDIDEQLITNCLYTNKSPDPDLLVRTSGEVRLSDFLLWQTSTTQIYFANVLWPEFSLYNLLAAIFKYQRHYNEMLHVKKVKTALCESKCSQHSPRIIKFLDHVNRCRINQLQTYAQA